MRRSTSTTWSHCAGPSAPTASSGFLFINTHQPHEPLAGSSGVQFRIDFAGGSVTVPDRPIDIPSGLIARWPLRLELAGARIEWATASVAGVVDGPIPTIVLRAHDGIPTRLRFAPGSRILTTGEEVVADEPFDLAPGNSLLVDDALRVLVVDERQAERLWYLGDDLIDSPDAVWREQDGLVLRAEHVPTASRWTGSRFVPLKVETASAYGTRRADLITLRAAGEPPIRYGEFMGRSSAPTDAQIDEVAAVWKVALPHQGAITAGDLVELVIDWEGDVAQLRLDGIPIRDRFWDGLTWRVDVTDVDPALELTLHIVPITAESIIDLDGAARARVDADRRLCTVRSITRVVSARWSETARTVLGVRPV